MRYYVKKIEICDQCPLRFSSSGRAHCSGKENFRENFLPEPYLGRTLPPNWCPLPQSLCVEETKKETTT
jgi:hypothetical protein